VALVRERTVPTERPPLVGEVTANFCGYRCCVVSATDPYGHILGFLDRSRYYIFQGSPISPIVITRLSGPRSRLTTSQKIW
jgi:hypothetical protein